MPSMARVGCGSTPVVTGAGALHASASTRTSLGGRGYTLDAVTVPHQAAHTETCSPAHSAHSTGSGEHPSPQMQGASAQSDAELLVDFMARSRSDGSGSGSGSGHDTTKGDGALAQEQVPVASRAGARGAFLLDLAKAHEQVRAQLPSTSGYPVMPPAQL